MSEEINRNRRSFLATTVLTIAATQLGRLDRTKQHATPATAELPIEGELPSLGGAIAWLNSQPLTVDGLRGKVVLINFWTYTCINWLRQLPYVRAWAEKYKDQGLAVIGVHTPEFEFEKNIDNVRRASTEMRIDYPIAVDNDYAVWRAFGNHYWPALYFIDTQGRIRHHQFGEGGYEQSERVIQPARSTSCTGLRNRHWRGPGFRSSRCDRRSSSKASSCVSPLLASGITTNWRCRWEGARPRLSRLLMWRAPYPSSSTTLPRTLVMFTI
ncbi:MAG: thioredoxin family protein [Microcoleus sp. SIO2G3]|nr:thioredoxin family protein [Microcoleus sp. SIO2G3]